MEQRRVGQHSCRQVVAEERFDEEHLVEERLAEECVVLRPRPARFSPSTSRRRNPLAWLFACSISGLLALGGCGSVGYRVQRAAESGDLPAALAAYDAQVSADGHDFESLARVAELVLEQAASAGLNSGDANSTANPDAASASGLQQTNALDERAVAEAVVRQLRYAGQMGRPALRRLASDTRLRWSRVLALEALSSAGDEISNAELYGIGLDAASAEFHAVAVAASRAPADGARLVVWLDDENSELRRAAALRLAEEGCLGAAGELVRRLESEEHRRVRDGLVRALGALAALPASRVQRCDLAGELSASEGRALAISAAFRALADPSASSRLAALRSLLRAVPGRMVPRAETWFDAPPSPTSIEAARFLLSGQFEERSFEPSAATLDRAHAHLLAASSGGRHRAQAVIAWMSASDVPEDTLALLLASEEDPAVLLQLGRLLYDRDDDAASALQALANAETMTGVQAALVLARDGDARAEGLLLAALSNETPLVRLVAVRHFGQARAAHLLRPLLESEDLMTRITAAGAILKASHRGY